MQLVQEEWRCINQRKNIVSSSNSIQNVLIWQIMHFSVQLSTFCVPKPTRQAPIFSELNFRHKNTRDVTFEKLEVRLQTKMITDKNDRWSAKLIVYRQKWSIIFVCGYCTGTGTKYIHRMCLHNYYFAGLLVGWRFTNPSDRIRTFRSLVRLGYQNFYHDQVNFKYYRSN